MRNNFFHIRFGSSMPVGLMFLMLFGCTQNQQSGHVDKQGHPRLTITPSGVSSLQKAIGTVPLFDQSLQMTIAEVNAEIKKGIDVPVPKDEAGGYTHDRHKRNFFIMQKAGALYQILGEAKYALFIKQMLMKYAAMYPTLGLHPSDRSYAPGKLFWQCLNDANWLVYTSQAYDCIYHYLTIEERKYLEKDLFRPYADFLSLQNPKFFNRIHNHSTWGCAAVGMIGLVMDDELLVNRALFGLKKDQKEEGAKDNDGGLINTYGAKKAGFLSQIDLLFSPDGYYTEGPYYQRYALLPFLVFAQSLENVKPELGIFKYRDGLLGQAVLTLINLSTSNGEFYPINDAQKGMSYYASSVVTAVDIVYHLAGNDPRLLDIAQKQNRVILDEAGLAVATDIALGKTQMFVKKSMEIRDGANGNEGGLGILRTQNENELSVLFKYAAQGMGHGHFDKLSYSLYRGEDEVLQDYGAARFVNIEQKSGGRYLLENKTFAKQSIAHNTLVINEQSHYEGDVKIGNVNHPDLYFFDASKENIQIISAIDQTAYPSLKMHRTLALAQLDSSSEPVMIDILVVDGESPSQMDLPFYYQGQVMSANFDITKEAILRPLGKANGYQHLWLEAKCIPESEYTQFAWLDKDKFYTLTNFSPAIDQVLLARVGANDQDFNLRSDPVLIFRTKQAKNNIYISIIEPHGSYSTVSEFVSNPQSNIARLKLEYFEEYTSIKIKTQTGNEWRLVISNKSGDTNTEHRLEINKNQSLTWKGPYYFYQL